MASNNIAALTTRASKAMRLRQIGQLLLETIGEDTQRDGLRDTPRRFAQWWLEFTEFQPGKTETAFESVQTDQMVIVRDMRVWSLCEHHLLPFWADVTVGYIPGSKVLGLSKFARLAHKHAHRLQVQERFVADLADEIRAVTGSDDVAVIASGEHLCMTMRGVKTPAKMISSSVHGAFKANADTRREFLALAGQGAP